MTYTITLQDAPSDITDRARRDAEERFRRTLERALGGADAVLIARRAWQSAEGAEESEISTEDIPLAKQWIAAATKAQQDGLRELGESGAYFEIKAET